MSEKKMITWYADLREVLEDMDGEPVNVVMEAINNLISTIPEDCRDECTLDYEAPENDFDGVLEREQIGFRWEQKETDGEYAARVDDEKKQELINAQWQAMAEQELAEKERALYEKLKAKFEPGEK